MWVRAMNFSSLLLTILLPVKSPPELATWFKWKFIYFYLFIYSIFFYHLLYCKWRCNVIRFIIITVQIKYGRTLRICYLHIWLLLTGSLWYQTIVATKICNTFSIKHTLSKPYILSLTPSVLLHWKEKWLSPSLEFNVI